MRSPLEGSVERETSRWSGTRASLASVSSLSWNLNRLGIDPFHEAGGKANGGSAGSKAGSGIKAR